MGMTVRDATPRVAEHCDVQLEYLDDRLRIVTADGRSIDIDRSAWRSVVEDGNRLIKRGATGRNLRDNLGGWTPIDDARLRSLWNGGADMDTMINELDRNSGSIERRLFLLTIIRSKRELSGR